MCPHGPTSFRPVFLPEVFTIPPDSDTTRGARYFIFMYKKQNKLNSCVFGLLSLDSPFTNFVKLSLRFLSASLLLSLCAVKFNPCLSGLGLQGSSCMPTSSKKILELLNHLLFHFGLAQWLIPLIPVLRKQRQVNL